PPLLAPPRAQAGSHRPGASARLPRRDARGARSDPTAPGRPRVHLQLERLAGFQDSGPHRLGPGPRQSLLTAVRGARAAAAIPLQIPPRGALRIMKIVVFGLGYVGLTGVACALKSQHTVFGV